MCVCNSFMSVYGDLYYLCVLWNTLIPLSTNLIGSTPNYGNKKQNIVFMLDVSSYAVSFQPLAPLSPYLSASSFLMMLKMTLAKYILRQYRSGLVELGYIEISRSSGLVANPGNLS